MNDKPDERQLPGTAWRLLLSLAAIKLLMHFVSNGFLNYGMFRDEFYYLACSRHLAFGYVDQPSFSIALLWLSRNLFGDSLFAVRLLPALAGAASVVMTGVLVRELGGGRFAQVSAAIAMIAATVFFAIHMFFSMNAFDPLIWTVAFWLVVRIIDRNDFTDWLWLGIVIGIGLNNKISILWFCGGLFFGLISTQHRRLLLQKGPWAAAGIALLLFLPHVIWQIAHGFPTLEFMANASGRKMADIPYMSFMLTQIQIMHPFTLPLWLGGLLYLLFGRTMTRYRLFGFLYLAIFLLLLLSRTARPYYLAPAYPVLLASGCILLERLSTAGIRIVRYAYIVLLAAGGILTAPMGLPVLPVDTYIEYSRALGMVPESAERKTAGKLDQLYADMHGWEEMAQTFSEIYLSLPQEERNRCVIYGQNYGEAGALQYYSGKYELPRIVSAHNNYYFWGPPEFEVEVLITMDDRESLEEYFGSVEYAGTFTHEYNMPYERGDIHICREPMLSLKEAWPNLKNFN